MDTDLLVILGPTATGKTALAASVAFQTGAEIISADSRQVFRGMDIGTGKDIEEYTVNGQNIPYHLIDTRDAGYEYNVFEFVQDFNKAVDEILEHGSMPLLCGGTGLYLESVLLEYELPPSETDPRIRRSLEVKSTDELITELKGLRKLHNVTDTIDRERMYRAIEIEYARRDNKLLKSRIFANPLVIGIRIERSRHRELISKRLRDRLRQGMVEEVEVLLNQGVGKDDLVKYGLEYKFLVQYILGDINYDEMFNGLNTAIHQFAKRQMTWFRRMEKKGVDIIWLDGLKPVKENSEFIIKQLNHS